MLRFFRRIRQKLLVKSPQGKSDSAAARYLVYALGEIFLVVIGILIALQINNLNEKRKEKILERSTLLELNTSILTDIHNFEEQIKVQLQLATDSKALLDHIQAKKDYTPQLDTLWEKVVRYYLFRFNNSAFELLESRGIDLISNKALRNEIVKHYNFEQPFMQRQSDIAQHVSDQSISYFFDRLYPPITDDFRDNFNYKKEILLPTNYQAILDDAKIIPKLSHSIKIRYRLSQLVQAYIKKAKKLSSAIEKELDK